MPQPNSYTEHLMTQRDVRKVLVIQMPDDSYIEVASDTENIDALAAVFAKLRENDSEGTQGIFGPGWTFELDTTAKVCTSDGTVVREYDDAVSFPSPLMRDMVPPDDDES